MLVEDLIAMLSEYPPDMKVALTSVGGGFSDVEFVDSMQLVLDYNNARTGRGIHEDFDYVEVVNPDIIESHIVEDYIVIK